MEAATKTDRERIAAHVLQRFYNSEGSALYLIMYHAGEVPRALFAKASRRTGAENTTLSMLIAAGAEKYAAHLSDDEVEAYLTEFADYL